MDDETLEKKQDLSHFFYKMIGTILDRNVKTIANNITKIRV